MIRFHLLKFEKCLIFQIIDHDYPESYWSDQSSSRGLRYKDSQIENFIIYYNGELEINQTYISLNLDYVKLNSRKSLKVRHYDSNEERDINYDLYLRAMKYFIENKDKSINYL